MSGASAQSAPDPAPAAQGAGGPAPANSPRRTVVLRRCRRGGYALAGLLTALMVVLILAAFRDDAKINSDMGTAQAEVLSAGRLRSVIWFSVDGKFKNPPLGVLYPTNLSAGSRVDVEYYRPDPTLVRIKGRGAELAILPALSVAAVAWAVALPLGWFCGGLRWVPARLRRAVRRQPPPGQP